MERVSKVSSSGFPNNNLSTTTQVIPEFRLDSLLYL